MKVIAITGGIASGKSTVAQLLADMGGKGVEVFDCDAVARRLRESGVLTEAMVAAFGESILEETGTVSTEKLRAIVTADEEKRHTLEALVHPRVAEEFAAAVSAAREREDVHTFLLDAPLFFETTSAFDTDTVCTVACNPETQISRAMQRSGISRQEAEALLQAQLSTEEKIKRSDIVFWNEGPISLLEAQVRVFFNTWLAAEAKAIQARTTTISLNDLRTRPLNELQDMALAANRKGATALSRAELIYELARSYVAEGFRVLAEGILEFSKDQGAYLRDESRSLRPCKDDPKVPADLLRRYLLRPGNKVKVMLQRNRNGKEPTQLQAEEILTIENTPATDYTQPKDFDMLTPLFPKERLILENPDIKSPSLRVLDLMTPLGKGQRALIVAPPRGGKTVLLKTIARSIQANYPDAVLLILLLDERPEEVTDFEETVKAPVFASTFDEPSLRHAQLSDLVLERARRLVEQGRDVIIMLDSLTRLSRGYNANQIGGRTMSGGLGSNALEKPRKFFGAARNLEEGGSLTIIATCLVDTESRMDEIIFEEFKGTGNMEVRLDRELAERRIYPAISLPQSGTRNDDRLYHPDELERIVQLRRQLAQLPGWESLETLLSRIEATQNNAELLLRGLR